MKNLLDKIFPTLSDELIIVITLIICLLVTASIALFLVKKLSPKTNISELVAQYPLMVDYGSNVYRCRFHQLRHFLFFSCISLFYSIQRTLFGIRIQ